MKVLIIAVLATLCLSYFSKPYPINTQNISLTSITNQMLTKRDPGTCSCDLTSNTCDSGCCCDWDCRDIAGSMQTSGQCVNTQQNYSLPLHPCVSNSNIRSYNIESGEYSYSGPMTRIFCVVHDFYPQANTFYTEKATVQDQEISDLKAIAQNFATQIFTTPS